MGLGYYRTIVVGNGRWLLMGTDYFSKWVEAKPLFNIRDIDAKKNCLEKH